MDIIGVRIVRIVCNVIVVSNVHNVIVGSPDMGII